jgi:hypothetical protein
VVEWRAGVELIQVGYQDQDEIWRYYVKEAARQRGLLVPPPEPSPPIQDPEEFRESMQDAWRRLIRGDD